MDVVWAEVRSNMYSHPSARAELILLKKQLASVNCKCATCLTVNVPAVDVKAVQQETREKLGIDCNVTTEVFYATKKNSCDIFQEQAKKELFDNGPCPSCFVLTALLKNGSTKATVLKDEETTAEVKGISEATSCHVMPLVDRCSSAIRSITASGCCNTSLNDDNDDDDNNEMAHAIPVMKTSSQKVTFRMDDGTDMYEKVLTESEYYDNGVCLEKLVRDIRPPLTYC
ncbi:hypothetical protein JYU34_017462 [Plutella xylostella]|uniref:Uncharacterized protein n=1 Tax=Plutella xylostella TaxID=51655 RepID=A0ABQ7Q180_PLUXY|nr:hypothetical protein JYU34_017462 [Plutella xylostella]